MINSKAIFDVLKKIASRSSEIRRSDPLPLLAGQTIPSVRPLSPGFVTPSYTPFQLWNLPTRIHYQTNPGLIYIIVSAA